MRHKRKNMRHKRKNIVDSIPQDALSKMYTQALLFAVGTKLIEDGGTITYSNENEEGDEETRI